MGFGRFVQLGRVCLVSRGPDEGKLVVIVDFVDQNRALVDGPCTGVRRQVMNFKWMEITNIKMNIHHLMRSATLAKAWEKEEITAKWEATSWAKRLAAKGKRASMNDFDRYKLMRAKQVRRKMESGLVRKVAKIVNEKRTAKFAKLKLLKQKLKAKKK